MEIDAPGGTLASCAGRGFRLTQSNLEGRAVVDVAAGTGRWALHCAKRGARATAVDFCFEMLRGAPRSAVQADARRLPFGDASADIVICAFALGYAPECFTELARITRPGGMLLVSDGHPDAVARGWTRSFRHRGEVIRVVDQPYEVADLHAPGLRLSSIIEPRLGLPERDFFKRGGRLDLFDEACRKPAIFVALFLRD
jgi:malonyl-CoA O-methyltransferase